MTDEQCKCGHDADDHDAGECWADLEGEQCSCDWWEPAVVPSGEKT